MRALESLDHKNKFRRLKYHFQTVNPLCRKTWHLAYWRLATVGLIRGQMVTRETGPLYCRVRIANNVEAR